MRNLYLLIILAVLFSACKKDKEELLGEFLLGNLIYTNPLSGHEILVFQNTESNEIIRFIGNGRTRITEKCYIDYYKNQYYIVETDNCIFNGENINYKLTITIKSDHYYPHYLLVLRLFDFQSSEFDYFTSFSHFKLPLNDNNLRSDQIRLDSLYIQNRYYYDVFIDTSWCSVTIKPLNRNDSMYAPVFYYNTTHGMLKIDFTDSTSWELKEIIP